MRIKCVPSAEWRRHSFFGADAILPKGHVHRELAASGLDRLMIKIKTARRKLTFIRGEIKELVTDF